MEPESPSIEEFIRRRVVLRLPGMGAVSRRRDLVYKHADGQPLHMDVYAPPDARACPLVILVHGGPVPRLGARNLGVFVSHGELLAVSGCVAVCFDHRFLAPERLPDAARDVEDLLIHARAAAPSWGADPERVALWAFSGGGPLLAAALRARPAYVRALVAYYAVMDLQQPPADRAPALAPELLRAFSPLDALGADARDAPALLVARAGRDDAWLNAGLGRFAQAALERGATLDLLNHAQGRHAFDVLDDDARSREIVGRTLAFLRERLSA